MVYSLCGIIGHVDTLNTHAIPHASVTNLKQGFGIIPIDSILTQAHQINVPYLIFGKTLPEIITQLNFYYSLMLTIKVGVMTFPKRVQ
jgi:hypothetical protein